MDAGFGEDGWEETTAEDGAEETADGFEAAEEGGGDTADGFEETVEAGGFDETVEDGAGEELDGPWEGSAEEPVSESTRLGNGSESTLWAVWLAVPAVLDNAGESGWGSNRQALDSMVRITPPATAKAALGTSA